MKKSKLILILILILIFLGSNALAQTAKFDIVTYTPPVGWTVEKEADSITYTKGSDGNYCLIRLTRSISSTKSSSTNFRNYWKEASEGMADPQMNKPSTKGGWETELGLAPVEKDGVKFTFILTTFTGNGVYIPVQAATTSNAFYKDIQAFIDSIKTPPLAQH